MTNFATGIYSLPRAAALVNVHPLRLRAWFCGKDGAKPLIRSDLPRVDHQIAISFVNLIEANFIAVFSRVGVAVRTIRVMAEEAADFLGSDHPFATSAIFRTDTRRIFVETARRSRDPKLYDLKSHNWAMHKVLVSGLVDGVEFNAHGLAKAWAPRKSVAPDVRVNPKVAFGSPALRKSGVPTETLFSSWLAESKNTASVARWFEVTKREVAEAVAFEESLIKPN